MRITRRFNLPPRPLALAVLLALLWGTAAAEPPRLTPAAVAALVGDAATGCSWRFVESASVAAGGSVERWRPSGCTASGVRNLRLVAGGDGRLAVTVLLPGNTRQPLAVQEAAILAVLSRAAGNGCRERRVVDTAVVATSAKASIERWVVVACGARQAYRLTFTTDAAGPPSIAVEPADATASLPPDVSR